MSTKVIVLELNLIAAKAASLADQIQRSATWPGDVSTGIAEIDAALKRAASEPEARS